MIKTYKVALIGCGRIASKRHIPLLGNNEVVGASLSTICDIDYEKAKPLADLYQAPLYTDFNEMVEKEAPYIITILTPSGLHARHIQALLKYRKPLIVEKPLALILSEAETVMILADQLHVPIFVVKQNRFNPPVVHLKRAVDEGRFGEIVLATVTVRWCRKPDYYEDWHGTWEMAGGVLANQAIHHIDLLTWILGQPSRVFAYATSRGNIAVEDTLIGVAQYAGGTLASLELTAATRPVDLEGSITIQGTHGTAKVGGFAVNEMSIWKFDREYPEDEAIRESIERPPNIYGYGHKAFYEHVLDCLNNDKVTPIDGRTSLRVVTALYQSVETGKEVDLTNEPVSRILGVS